MIAKILLGLAALLTIALSILFFIQIQSDRTTNQVWRSLESKPATTTFMPEMIADLPEPVQRYFLHAIAPGTPIATAVQLQLSGQFRLAPDQAWMPMRSQEILSAKGFVWKAKVGEGVRQMHGADYYANGTGRMRFFWGVIPLVDAHDADTMRSAIGRFAGEWFWLPSALLPQQGVSWSAIDPQTIQASFKVEGEPITLTMVIDENGKLLKSFGSRWGDRTSDRHYAYIPFGGKFQSECTFGGFTIPSQIGAGWWIDSEQYFEFFQATVEQAQFN